MSENEIEAVKNISAAIEESHTKIIISTQCSKLQRHFINKLSTEAERDQETCSFLRNVNQNLGTEIARCQQGISSYLSYLDTIKKDNVERNKELLLNKEKKQYVIESVKNDVKKYEKMWLESKARYESLSFVQKLMKDKEELQNIEKHINELENEEEPIHDEMKIKKEHCREIERKRIVEFVKYIVAERAKLIKMKKEKSAAINEIEDKLKALEPKTNNTILKPDENEQQANNATSLFPKLNLNYLDFGNLNANLDKVKSDDPYTRPPLTYSVQPRSIIDTIKLKRKISNVQEYISSFFYKPVAKFEEKSQNYGKMKLINILDDIKISNSEVKKMVAHVDPGVLQEVDSISITDRDTIEKDNAISNVKDNGNVEDEHIETLDLTASGSEKMIMPPTQFLDVTTESQLHTEYNQVSQNDQFIKEIEEQSTSKNMSAVEEPAKKKVKFDLSHNEEAKVVNEIEKPENKGETDANLTINSQSDVNEDEFAKIKETIMKQHNLDSSPQFVYGKNTITPMSLQKPEEPVTSKFFPQEPNQQNAEIKPQLAESTAIEEDLAMAAPAGAIPKEMEDKPVVQGILRKDKIPKLTQQREKPMSGYLTRHNTQMTSYMDESANTSVFGDADEIPSLDTSFLSPKADVSLPNVDSQEGLSQDMPFFLGGTRKSGLSFFGRLSTDPKTESSQNQSHGTSGFSFNFGGEQKKTRGGLFSMFQ